MGDGGAFSSADRAALEARLGLDQPFLVRYMPLAQGLFRGTWGTPTRTGLPVARTIAQRVVPSLILTGTGVVDGHPAAIPLGAAAAWKPRTVWDKLASGCAMVSFGIPGFLLCLTGVYIFSLKLGLPALGPDVYGGQPAGAWGTCSGI